MTASKRGTVAVARVLDFPNPVLDRAVSGSEWKCNIATHFTSGLIVWKLRSRENQKDVASALNGIPGSQEPTVQMSCQERRQDAHASLAAASSTIRGLMRSSSFFPSSLATGLPPGWPHIVR